MTKNRILVLLVGVLLLTNAALLYFFLTKDCGPKEMRRSREAAVKEMLQQQVGFSPAQLQQYETLSSTHREAMRPFLDSMHTAREAQLKQLAAAGFTDSAMSVAATASATRQQRMELLMLGHIKKIRALCTPAQQPVFDTMYHKLVGRRGMRKAGGGK